MTEPAGPLAAEASDVVVSGVNKEFEAGHPVLIDVDVDVAAGRTLALLGPSGCGKTTLLRIIAGLETPDGGTVSVGGRELTGPHTYVVPEARRVGMVFQDWALFEHLTVAGNVGFGLPRGERRASPRIDAALDLVGLGGLGGRRIATLSGGQRQRVALARAVAPRPSVLLLDEPFSNLDAALRAEVRTEVHELLVELGITTVFVTHDQDEAFVLGDRVAVLADGVVVQSGSAADLYLRPATRWLAGFVGDANFFPAVATDGRAATPFGDVELVGANVAGVVDVMARPEQLTIAASPLRSASTHDDPTPGEGGPIGTVDLVEYVGHSTTYFVRCADLVVRVRQSGEPIVAHGDRVIVRAATRRMVAYPPESA